MPFPLSTLHTMMANVLKLTLPEFIHVPDMPHIIYTPMGDEAAPAPPEATLPSPPASVAAATAAPAGDGEEACGEASVSAGIGAGQDATAIATATPAGVGAGQDAVRAVEGGALPPGEAVAAAAPAEEEEEESGGVSSGIKSLFGLMAKGAEDEKVVEAAHLASAFGGFGLHMAAHGDIGEGEGDMEDEEDEDEEVAVAAGNRDSVAQLPLPSLPLSRRSAGEEGAMPPPSHSVPQLQLQPDWQSAPPKEGVTLWASKAEAELAAEGLLPPDSPSLGFLDAAGAEGRSRRGSQEVHEGAEVATPSASPSPVAPHVFHVTAQQLNIYLGAGCRGGGGHVTASHVFHVTAQQHVFHVTAQQLNIYLGAGCMGGRGGTSSCTMAKSSRATADPHTSCHTSCHGLLITCHST